MSSALASRPLASRTLRRPVMSWLISRIARIGFSIVRSRITTPSSIIRSTRSQLATLSIVVVSLMLESPTMTCSRRYFSASACGSSRVLMIGRLRVVALRDALPDVLGALADASTTRRAGVCITLPAPTMICRVTRNGISTSASRLNSPARPTR